MDNFEKFYLISINNRKIYNNPVINNHINSNNNSKENVYKKFRIYYFDILRTVSSFSVVLIHVSARYYKSNIYSNNWKIAHYYNGISRFGVPIFLMISGALFLSKDISISQMLKKYIRRLLIKLIFWSFIYSIYRRNLSIKNIPIIIIHFFLGSYHFWYLNVIIELYLITPFLRELIKKDLLNIFLKLSFIFTFIIPNINDFNSYFPQILSKIVQIINMKLDYKYIKGYIFYFMFGYYLNNKKMSLYNVIIIYIFGIIGFLFTTIILYQISIIEQKKNLKYFRGLNLNILLYSTSIFVFFKLNLNNYKINLLLKRISNYTFGIYLIHPLVLYQIRRISRDFVSIKLLFKIPLISIIVFLISLMICIIIKILPIFGKYI